jgi:hypothetical protein
MPGDQLHSGPMQNESSERAQPYDDVVERIVAGLTQQQPDPLIRYQALSHAQEVYEAVARRIAAERARAVSEMHDSGQSYGRIAELIGFTRSRAQQLAERADPPAKTHDRQDKQLMTQETLTLYLDAYTATWPRSWNRHPFRPNAQPVAQRHSAEEIAGQLYADANFRALQLGTWLNTPDGELLAAAVEALTPPPYQQDIELLVEALQLAAKMQQRDARGNAVAAGLLIAAGGALLASAARA